MHSRSETIIAVSIIAISIFVSAIVLSMAALSAVGKQVSLKEQELRNQAVDECSKIAVAQYRDTQDNSQITEPFKPSYIACLKDKGYESTVRL